MDSREQRKFKLSIQTFDGQTVVIANPFTLEFEIQRTFLSSVNIGSFKLYNLSKFNRNLLRKDLQDTGVRKKIKLEVGYGNQLSTVFKGHIKQGYSERQGVNIISHMESGDGAYVAVNSKFQKSFPKNSDRQEIINDVVAQLKKDGVATGAIGKIKGKIPRGNTYNGQTVEVLQQTVGNSFFIDNETVNVLNDNEVIEGKTIVVSSQSGLLNTPIRQGYVVSFDTLLDPRIKIGQRIKIESSTLDADVRTSYKVMAVTHKGIISDAINGQCITTIQCLPGVFDGVVTENGVQVRIKVEE